MRVGRIWEMLLVWYMYVELRSFCVRRFRTGKATGKTNNRKVRVMPLLTMYQLIIVRVCWWVCVLNNLSRVENK